MNVKGTYKMAKKLKCLALIMAISMVCATGCTSKKVEEHTDTEVAETVDVLYEEETVPQIDYSKRLILGEYL